MIEGGLSSLFGDAKHFNGPLCFVDSFWKRFGQKPKCMLLKRQISKLFLFYVHALLKHKTETSLTNMTLSISYEL